MTVCQCAECPRRETVWGTDNDAPDGRSVFRYTLWREFEPELWTPRAGQFVMFIGLNPSTATETADDPTIRRCMGFARRWGYGALLMTNLFAYRATEPEAMKRHPAPAGPENDRWLATWAQHAGLVVAAWGKHGSHLDRASEVVKLLASFPMRALQRNRDKSPKHPLYVRADVTTAPYEHEHENHQNR